MKEKVKIILMILFLIPFLIFGVLYMIVNKKKYGDYIE